MSGCRHEFISISLGWPMIFNFLFSSPGEAMLGTLLFKFHFPPCSLFNFRIPSFLALCNFNLLPFNLTLQCHSLFHLRFFESHFPFYFRIEPYTLERPSSSICPTPLFFNLSKIPFPLLLKSPIWTQLSPNTVEGALTLSWQLVRWVLLWWIAKRIGSLHFLQGVVCSVSSW